jgi:hypothetical protein
VLDVTKVDLPLDAKPPSPEVIVPMIDLPEIVIGADTGAGTFKSSRLSLPHPAINELNKTTINRINFFILFIHVL